MSAGPDPASPALASHTPHGDSAHGGRLWLSGRRVAAILAVALILVATALALFQPLHPNPLKPRTGLADWLYPTETNAWWRLPEIRAGLSDLELATGPGGEDLLWAVGYRGAILHSRDGGRCWEWQGPWRPLGESRVCAPGRLWDTLHLFPEAAAEADLPTPIAPDSGTGYDAGPPRAGRTSAAVPRIREILRKGGFYDAPTPSDPELFDDALTQSLIAFQRSWGLIADGMVGAMTLRALEEAGAKLGIGEAKAEGSVRDPSQRAASPEPQMRAPVPLPPSPAPSGAPNLYAVDFVDARHGWAVGHDSAILATSDGGATWVVQAAAATNGRMLLALQFLDLKTGWVAGGDRTVLATQDGGATWTVQTSGTDVDLRALGFADARTGWAVGDRGTVLKTGDGGATWTIQASGTDESLNGLHVIDGRTAWAAGESGTLLKTSDGGTTWTPRESGVSVGLYSVGFQTPRNGWAIGMGGTLLRTVDGGESWYASRSGTLGSLVSLRFADSNSGWAIGRDGAVLRTDDGGASWWSLTAGPTGALIDLALVDRQRGWAVGRGGTILTTRDGGTTWVPQDGATDEDLKAVRFHDARTGWVVGLFGAFQRTRDGGVSWENLEGDSDLWALAFADRRNGLAAGSMGLALGTNDGGETWGRLGRIDDTVFALTIADPRTAWAAGRRGSVSRTDNGGVTWVRQETGTDADLQGIRFVDRQIGWAVGQRGTILRTADGGTSWTASTSGTPVTLRSVGFADPRNGWAVGDAGTILRTFDGGVSWTAQPSGTAERLTALYVLDPETALAVGSGRTVLKTEDGGQHWQSPLAPYRVGPAPWYWVSLLVCLGLLGYAASPERPRVVGQSVADLFASDRPLRSRWETDALGLGTIADSLSEFLRNGATEAPLTVAIVGDWGSGKTSLMNLLRADLERNRFQPVWFNAWHHQKGEQILASLFAHVREQSIPPLLSWRGLAFRWRLLVRRGAPLWLLVTLLTVVLSASAAYLGDSIAEYSGRAWAVMQDPERIWSVDWRPLTAFFSAVVGLSGSVFGLWKAMQGFGLDPRRLVTVNPEGGKGSGLDPGARARFARELRDVTECLKPRKMTVFIDDLDRCHQQSLIEVLEAVSFLASSGDCFIVLGMSERWVEASVGLEYETLAQAMSDQAQNGTPPEELRRRFARNYLEKLVNLAVPVPDLERQRAELLVDGPAPKVRPGEAAESDVPARPGWVRRLLAGADGLWQPLILGAAVVYGVWFGADLLHKPPASVPEPPAQLWSSSELRLNATQAAAQSGPGAAGPAGESAASPLAAAAPAPRTLTELLGLEVGLRADPKVLEQGVVVAEHGGVQVLLRRPVHPERLAVAQGPVQPAAPETPADPQPTDDGDAPPGLYAGQSPASAIPVWLWVPGLALLGLWSYRSARRARQEITQDSLEFRTALKIWLPLPFARQDTPRAIKRFINRLRYISIRLRKSGGKEFPEPNTVALAAIYSYDPAKFRGWDFQLETPGGQTSASAEDETVLRECTEAYRRFAQERSLPWPPSDAHREAFLAVLAERGGPASTVVAGAETPA
jgi:photosystem II stability/assembly factor-like uncharacterized protein